MIVSVCPFPGDGLVEIIFDLYMFVFRSLDLQLWRDMVIFWLPMQVFATPETLIGFHPDAGASFYLSHLPGYLGSFLHCFVFLSFYA